MRQTKPRRLWPWIVLILVLIAIISALVYGFWSKLQAESHLPTLDTEQSGDALLPPEDTNGEEDDPIVDDPVVDDPPEDTPPKDDPPEDAPPVEQPPEDDPPEDTPPKDDPPVDDPPVVDDGAFHTKLTGSVVSAGYAVSDERLAVMEQFMSAWYTPLAEFGSPDFGEMFSKEKQSDSHADALRTLIAIRQAALTDLRMNSVDYTLTITDVEPLSDGRLRIEADETAHMRFAATPGIDSILYDLPHIFIFDKDAATLSHHEADDNPYFSYNRAENSDYDAEYGIIMNSIAARQQTYWDQTVVELPCDHPYDVDSAISYLYAYCDERNPYWYAYDAVGGNCMNFGSQVLLAGGIPRDEQGSAKWYWDNKNELALSWINVGRFYEYCRDNSGYGLVADTEASYYTGEIGDVVIVGFDEDHRHTTLISGIVRDDAGNVVDYLITCNTTNYRDFPVSAYYYTFHRLIKIFGWNEG